MIADNIVFVDEANAVTPGLAAIAAAHRIETRLLSPAAFVTGCISRPDRPKGELGFLKPVMARAFLDAHGLRYDESMRLSEDYNFYARALIAGGRFRLAAGCHYVAVEYATSLSSVHGARELAMAERAAAALIPLAGDDAALADALARQHAQVARKHRHRALLARKHEVGTLRALAEQVPHPTQLADVVADIARDKWHAFRSATVPHSSGPRFLL